MSGSKPDQLDTERLLGALVDDVQPVRRISSPGGVAIIIGLLFAAVWLSVLLLLDAKLEMGRLRAGAFAGLLLSVSGAVGGLVAGREPGLERARRVALLVMGSGALVFFGTLFVWGVETSAAAGWMLDLRCISMGVAIGAMPAALLVGIARRAWTGRPRMSALFACAGGLALGALAVQVVCQSEVVGHIALGHYVGPVLVAVFATLLLAPLISYRFR